MLSHSTSCTMRLVSIFTSQGMSSSSTVISDSPPSYVANTMTNHICRSNKEHQMRLWNIGTSCCVTTNTQSNSQCHCKSWELACFYEFADYTLVNTILIVPLLGKTMGQRHVFIDVALNGKVVVSVCVLRGL